MKISQILDEICELDIVLPEFQREFVWNRDQAKKLIGSLFKEYPVGSLLFWKTSNPPALKNVDNLPKKLGLLQVILDGQQRLTTLFMFINGSIPPYYREKDIKYDPRRLYFNIDTAELMYYQATTMKNQPIWVSVVDVFNNSKDILVFEIAKSLYEDDGIAFKQAQIFTDNLTNLKNIRNFDLPILSIPSQANINVAIDIFDLVNRQGTKLTDADLALTHMTGHWPEARRVLKGKLDELGKKHFEFDLSFMTRAMTGVVTNRALFEIIHDRPKEELIAGWKKLNKILDYLVSILPNHAFIHSTQDVNTNNIFIPIIVYLSVNDGKFKSKAEINNAIHWLYLANIWARYTSQTDQKLEFDLSIVVRNTQPWEELIDAIKDQRGRTRVDANDLEGRSTSHPLYRMTYVLAKANGAMDWENGIPLGGSGGNYFGWQSHHIFPSSLLYEEGYDPKNHIHKKIVNEIANRAFLTADTNINISNNPPNEYLPEIEKNFPGALTKQFIPMNEELWKLENYENFLELRRETIAKCINEYLDGLIIKQEEVRKKSIEEIITLGESISLEFKSSLQWDVRENQINKKLRHSVLKTIAAFLNSEGGTLVIGVEDNGNVFGLEGDYKTTNNSKDKYLNLINTLIGDYIGLDISPYINMRIENIQGNDVCVVKVDKSHKPVFMKTEGQQKQLFIRRGTTTHALDPEETYNYIETNWG
ncbi:MAG: DUF262 domain-containing protein [Chloroflexota bacterium]|nr:DUF262 domain-containing protein [Chloroflexota bacterium]